MASIGETLRAARQEKKVTLEEASRFTKIKVEILDQLEADNFTSLGGPMYVKSFLKLYAAYLGLDSKLIGDTYLQSQGGLRRHGLRLETEVALMAERQRNLRLPLGVIVGVLGAISLLLLSWWGVRHWRATQSVSKAPAPVPVAVAPKVVVLPRAGFDPIYQPKTKPVAEMLDTAGK
jgi:cytoskeletal protein RodZ